MANISQIFMKGRRKVAEKYHPVSLTSITSKIMEAAVRGTILTHLKRNRLLSTRQFGFLEGRSTILQLLTFLDKCVEEISRGNVTDVVYLDFQRGSLILFHIWSSIWHKWGHPKLGQCFPKWADSESYCK